MEEINIHFTGDLHAVAAAHNLAAAFLDNHLFRGNALNIDPTTIRWPRVIDVNDRALRRVEIGLGEKSDVVRQSEWHITAASEVMAILALASDLRGSARATRSRDRGRGLQRRARHARAAQGRRRDGRAAARGDQAKPRPDARRRPGLHPRRPVRQHRPRQLVGRGRSDRAQARRRRRHRGWLRRGHGLPEVHRHQVPAIRPASGRGRHRGHDPRAEDARRRGPRRGRQAARPGA